jgi:hypothetical protein
MTQRPLHVRNATIEKTLWFQLFVILKANREAESIHNWEILVPAEFINISNYLRKILWQIFCLTYEV